MPQIVNEKFGKNGTNNPLGVVPINGSVVKIQIFNSSSAIVGETTSDSNGKWKKSFLLIDGTYKIIYSGGFAKPVGQGFYGTFTKPVSNQQIIISVSST